ncbi:Transposon Ty3-G Gag-Pol polyprotein [Labeo rohita]|uniref:Gypsy retrotransposon integrase-like protein 1 n=1 Tax=Labeo rohita TaxID=84645 RepID=A0ABQ8M5Q9_LABRO|nr:Transposon Ty3-G Gag-Pol polyprotein [Labeo rohita]
MEDLLKCLTEVSVRQQQIVEHIAGRQGQVEEELAALRLAAAQRVPLPDPRIKATQLLPKLTGDDDIELYLQMFETTATRENWDQSEWARLLGPLLTGEAQRAYFSLPTELAESYDNLKKEILGRLGLSPISAAQLFHEWEYKPRHPARAQAAELARLARHWLLEGAPTAGQVAERVTIDRLLRALPPAARRAVGMTNPTTIAELVGSIELAEAAMRRDPGERAPSFPRRVGQERRAPEGTQRTVHRPAAPGPVDEPMPTEDPAPPPRTWMAGCIVHREPPRGAPRAEVKINGRAALALLDSGSSVSLVQAAILPPRKDSKAHLPITCVHGDTQNVPARRVTISAAPGAWPVEVGILKELPVPVLLGRDWPGFEQLLLATTQPASQAGSRRDRRNKRHPRRPALLASDSGRDGESPSSNTNVFFDVFQQVAGGGSFAKAQLEDDRLKHCWTQVRVIENQEQQPAPHPLPHFIVKNGLLYCVAQRRGEVKELLVVPKGKVEMIMELAHAHPMAGHLGAANTAQRIRDRFHWPGLDGDVKRFCQACPACQKTSPRAPPPSPLIPLPIIGVPFERIGMDLVGPLPKSARGHEHILVIVDYATRFPEAMPLRKATAKNIAKELFLLCTRVGIPAEILTDQGTPFMSRLMADLCRLLRVKQIRTTVFHPQTDGLVERFNQTLKQMLKRVAAEDRRDWDLMIPYVLFGVREIPQASTGFTPFELLFGRQPRGLLDVAREAWEQQQPAPLRSAIEHVREMRERIERVMPLVREHLTKAQQSQQRIYNRAAQPREFQPGDRVMVLVPTSACKFLATWQGPYTVIERIGPVTYRLRQPGRRREEQLYHVNLLKRWVGTREQLTALASVDPAVIDVGDHLSAAQKTELSHLVSQFSDVFSTRPGQTNVIQHDIRTPPGVIVRQRPYRVPEARRQAIEDEISEMLKLGIIEPSRSAWSSPIVMVPKPDGTLRFCNDFRRLNEVSEFDGYPMPRVDELLERLGRARFITTLDLTKGYWQVPLTTSAKEKTAFSTPSGHWQYRTLPFGLHGAPATFQRMMDVILRPHQSYAAAYLDDVIIHSETWQDHLERLRRVLLELRRAGLTANPRKCHLALAEAQYLGFRVGRGLIQPQKKKRSTPSCQRPAQQPRPRYEPFWGWRDTIAVLSLTFHLSISPDRPHQEGAAGETDVERRA